MSELVANGGNMPPDLPQQNIIKTIMGHPAIVLRHELRTHLQYVDGHFVPLFDVGLNTEKAFKCRDAALRRCKKMPSMEKLQTARDAFREATYGKTDEAAARLIGVAMPAAVNYNAATSYTDAMVDVLMFSDDDDRYPGFTPPVLALAARDILRTERFPPSIALFLERAREERGNFYRLLAAANTLIELRDDAEWVLIMTDDITLPDDGW
jgi:hypothetical protein